MTGRMSDPVRHFIDRLGGYRPVAARLGVAPTTLHSHMTSGKLPPRFYRALCSLADEAGIARPGDSLFSFAPLKSTAGADTTRGAA